MGRTNLERVIQNAMGYTQVLHRTWGTFEAFMSAFVTLPDLAVAVSDATGVQIRWNVLCRRNQDPVHDGNLQWRTSCFVE